MDPKATDHFADIIAFAQATLDQVEYVAETTPKRAILRLEAQYSLYRVLVTELLSEEARKYRY